MTPDALPMFFAHSENARGKKHVLMDCLKSAAELTRSFSPSKDHESVFYLAGLGRDTSKYQDQTL